MIFFYYNFYVDYMDEKHVQIEAYYPSPVSRYYIFKVDIDLDSEFLYLLEKSIYMRGYLDLEGYHFDWMPDLGQYLNEERLIRAELEKIADKIPMHYPRKDNFNCAIVKALSSIW